MMNLSCPTYSNESEAVPDAITSRVLRQAGIPGTHGGRDGLESTKNCGQEPKPNAPTCVCVCVLDAGTSGMG